LRPCRSRSGACCRDHLVGADLWLAHAVHLLPVRAGNRAHRRERRLCRPRVAASRGSFGSRGWRDERTGARACVGLCDRAGIVCRHERLAHAPAAGSHVVKTKLVAVTVVALTVWGLKRHYSDAGADDLRWMLSPTAWLVS